MWLWNRTMRSTVYQKFKIQNFGKLNVAWRWIFQRLLIINTISASVGRWSLITRNRIRRHSPGSIENSWSFSLSILTRKSWWRWAIISWLVWPKWMGDWARLNSLFPPRLQPLPRHKNLINNWQKDPDFRQKILKKLVCLTIRKGRFAASSRSGFSNVREIRVFSTWKQKILKKSVRLTMRKGGFGTASRSRCSNSREIRVFSQGSFSGCVMYAEWWERFGGQRQTWKTLQFYLIYHRKYHRAYPKTSNFFCKTIQ